MGEPTAELVRLSKLMSEKGLCSRREADVWIEKGWVYVNGEVISQLGAKIPLHSRVTLDPQALREQKQLLSIVLHKPMGYVSSTPEDNHPHALSLITPENQWSEAPQTSQRNRISTFRDLKGLAPAGRLDIDSQGLIVFTQDGRLAKKLISPDSDIEKEYLVRVDGTITARKLSLLKHGLELDGRPLRPARIYKRDNQFMVFILQEGRKRQIRRMCEAVDLQVTFLKRVRIGKLQLGALPVGQWMICPNSI